MRNLTLAAGAALLAGAMSGAPAFAQADFAGKTLTMIVGSDAAGGYDTYGRLTVRHMVKHLPGNPNVVVRNQPGAGSATAAAAIFNTAPKDGTWFGIIFPGVIIGPILDPKPQTLFDVTKFSYLGSADSGTRVCITFEKSQTKTFEDARNRKTIMGASAAGGSTRDYAYMLNHVAGAKFEVVSGYKGSADIFLALERGEVDGMCGLDWSSLKAQRGDWIKSKKLNILIQTGLDPEKELTDLGVPDMWRFISSPADKAAAELIVSQQIFGRPFVAPPGVPEPVLKTLRDAFDKTMADPEFKADAEKARIDINPSSGQKVQELVTRIFATPAETVARAKRIITQ
ncbi:MAG: Bug family tripartite tricarboxylate transporter substrate binding protein [Beijerinckiaceae bacterium]